MKKRTQKLKVSPLKRKRGRFGARFEGDGSDLRSDLLCKRVKRRRKAEYNKMRESSPLFKMVELRPEANNKLMRKAKYIDMTECRIEDSSVDRISMLPDELLELILSHLTFKEKIATSILSRRWRYLWTLTNRLDFDGIELLRRLASRAENGTSALEEEKLKYVSWVNHVLESRKESDIEDFKVCFNLCKNDEGCIDKWLRYALERKVQTLELNLTDEGFVRSKANGYYVFPYRFLYVVKENCSNSIHFKQLRKILLNQVGVDGETLEFFLHNCSLLEDLSVSCSTALSTLRVIGAIHSLKRLEISSCRNLNSLEISDVNLVYLKYSGSIINFLLQNLPMLVNLSVTNTVFNHMKANVEQFWSILQQLEILNLRKVSYRSRFFVKMTNLKQLVVTCSVECDDSLLLLTNLIRSSPLLQKFVLEVETKCWSQKIPKRELQLQRMKIKKSYRHLEEIEFVGFRGVPRDLEFVFHFVDSAVALKKILIDPNAPCTSSYAYKLRANLYLKDKIAAMDRVKKQLALEVPWKVKVDFRSLY